MTSLRRDLTWASVMCFSVEMSACGSSSTTTKGSFRRQNPESLYIKSGETMELSKLQKRRAAVESWKERNREYYLAQKKYLQSRPEYLAHRREVYRAKRELFLKDHEPPKRGRALVRSNYPNLEPWLRKYSSNDFADGSSECGGPGNPGRPPAKDKQEWIGIATGNLRG